MAAFKNQFSVCDPFHIPLRPAFFGWPTQIAIETHELLQGQELSRLTAIAKQIENVIKVALKENPLFDDAKSMLARRATAVAFKANSVREVIGDFSLFSHAHDKHDWETEKIKSSKWERFAIFALWKLVDEYLSMQEPYDLNSEIDHIDFVVGHWNRAGGYVIESSRALQTAQAILFEERLVSARNSRSNDVKKANANRNQKEAVRLANSKPFDSRDDALTYVAERLVKSTKKDGQKTTYSISQVARFLAREGWTFKAAKA